MLEYVLYTRHYSKRLIAWSHWILTTTFGVGSHCYLHFYDENLREGGQLASQLGSDGGGPDPSWSDLKVQLFNQPEVELEVAGRMDTRRLLLLTLHTLRTSNRKRTTITKKFNIHSGKITVIYFLLPFLK